MRNALFGQRTLRAAVSIALGLGFAVSALGATDLDSLKDQLEQQRKILEQQQKVIEQLQQQVANVSAAQQPTQAGKAGSASGSPLLSKMQVEIYGSLIPFAETIRATDATKAAPVTRPNQLAPAAYTGINQESRGRMTVGTSNIGFRGSMDIAKDYKAIWQIETGVAIDGDSSGIGNSNVLGLRNSNVGIATPYGTAFVGNWETPYKFVSIPTAPLRGATTFDFNNIIGNPGFGVLGTATLSGRTGGKADAAFDRRQGNSIQYWTPNWGGFSGRFGYSVGETRSNDVAVPSIDPRLWSLSLGYTNDTLYLQYAHEEHLDYFGMTQIGGGALSATNASSKDSGDKLVGMYTFKSTGTTLTGTYERLQYRNDDTGAAANVKEYNRNAYLVSVQQKLGPGKAWLSFSRADDGNCSTVGRGACNTSNLGAKQWNTGYVLNLTKFVDLYAAYYELNNELSGTYQPTNSVTPPTTLPAPGLKIKGLGAGAVVIF